MQNVFWEMGAILYQLRCVNQFYIFTTGLCINGIPYSVLEDNILSGDKQFYWLLVSILLYWKFYHKFDMKITQISDSWNPPYDMYCQTSIISRTKSQNLNVSLPI